MKLAMNISVFGFIGSVVAFPVYAEIGYSGAATLGYQQYSGDGGLDANGIDLRFDNDFSHDRLSFGVDVGWSNAEQDGFGLSNLSTSLRGAYAVSPGFLVGAYFERDSIDLDLGDIVNIDSYGLEMTSRGQAYEITGFVGKTHPDELGTLAGDLDVVDIGASGRFDATSELSVFGSLARSTISSGDEDIDLTSGGVGLLYAMPTGLSFFGSVQSAALDDIDTSVNTWALGVGYDTVIGSTPVKFSAEYAHANGEAFDFSADAERFTLGATILFGDAQKKRLPGNAITGDLLEGERNGLSGLLSSAGY